MSFSKCAQRFQVVPFTGSRMLSGTDLFRLLPEPMHDAMRIVIELLRREVNTKKHHAAMSKRTFERKNSSGYQPSLSIMWPYCEWLLRYDAVPSRVFLLFLHYGTLGSFEEKTRVLATRKNGTTRDWEQDHGVSFWSPPSNCSRASFQTTLDASYFASSACFALHDGGDCVQKFTRASLFPVCYLVSSSPLYFFFLFTAQNAGRTVCEETGSTNRRSASTWRTGRTRTVAQIEELRGDAGEGEEGSRTTTNKTNLKANQEGWEGARKGGGIMVVSHPLALPRLQRTMEQTALQERRSLRTVRAVPEPSRRYSERSYLLLLCYLTAFRHRPRRAERANLRRSSPRTAGRNSWQALDADGPRGGSVIRGGLISARLHGGRGGIPRIRLRPGPREGRRDGPEPRRRWSQLASPGGRRRDRRVVARWEESGGAARRETVGIVQNFRVHRCYLSSTATRVGGIVHELKEETLWKGRDKQE